MKKHERRVRNLTMTVEATVPDGMTAEDVIALVADVLRMKSVGYSMSCDYREKLSFSRHDKDIRADGGEEVRSLTYSSAPGHVFVFTFRKGTSVFVHKYRIWKTGELDVLFGEYMENARYVVSDSEAGKDYDDYNTVTGIFQVDTSNGDVVNSGNTYTDKNVLSLCTGRKMETVLGSLPWEKK